MSFFPLEKSKKKKKKREKRGKRGRQTMKVNKEEEQRGKYKNVQSKKKKIWRKKVEDERRK